MPMSIRNGVVSAKPRHIDLSSGIAKMSRIQDCLYVKKIFIFAVSESRGMR